MDDEDLWALALLIVAYFFGLVPVGILVPLFTQWKLDMAFFMPFLYSWPGALFLYFVVRSLATKFFYKPSAKYLGLRSKANELEAKVWSKTIEGDFYSDHSDIDRLDDAISEADLERQNSPFFQYSNQNKVKVVMMVGSTIVSSVVSSWLLMGPSTYPYIKVDFFTILISIFGLLFLFGPLSKWLIWGLKA